MRANRWSVLVAVAIATAFALPAVAGAQRIERTPTTGQSTTVQPRVPDTGAPGSTSTTTAPTTPTPAATPSGNTGVVRGARGDDLLAGNGLQSPWCKAPWGWEARLNCAAGGQASTGAVGNRWSWDIHVDTSSWTGAPRPGDAFISAFLELLRFLWGLMVAVTRGCFYLVEFALGFQPLDSSGQAGLARQLDQAADTITRPLALLLAPVGAVWLMWTGLQRRRQGEALQQLALMAVLGAVGLAVMHNPVSTINTVATSGQQLGLAVIGAASGSASGGERAAQKGLGSMGRSVIDQPLALMQFGDVDFGTNPKRLSPKLKAAATLRAAKEQNPKRLAAVRTARTNLDLFTAWPVGAGARNSINDEDSLLRVMCGADDTEKCEGPMARYAEFRTESGAWDRAVAIVIVLIPMVPLWVILAVTAVLMMAAQVMVIVRTVQLIFVLALSTAGKAGTERVVSYAGELLGDLLAAFKHAAFLALVLVIWQLFSTEVGTGAIGQWLVLAVVLVALLVKRESLWGFASNRPQQNAGASIATRMAAAWAMRSATRSVAGRMTGLKTAGKGQWTKTQAHRRAQGNEIPGTRAVRAALHGPMAPHLRADGADRQRRTADEARGVQPEAKASPVAAATGALPSAGGVEVPAGDDPVGAARANRARQVRAVLDERDSTAAGRVLDGEQEQQARTQLARRRGELARVRDLRGAERDPRKRQQLRKREVSLQRRADASQQRLARSDRARSLVSEPQVARRDRAKSWLRDQSKLDRGVAPRGSASSRPHRSYPQLAAMVGSSAQQYRSASSGQQLAMRAKIDRELRRHTTDGQIMAKDRARTARTTKTTGTPSTAAVKESPGPSIAPYRKDAARHEERRPGRSS